MALEFHCQSENLRTNFLEESTKQNRFKYKAVSEMYTEYIM